MPIPVGGQLLYHVVEWDDQLNIETEKHLKLNLTAGGGIFHLKFSVSLHLDDQTSFSVHFDDS